MTRAVLLSALLLAGCASSAPETPTLPGPPSPAPLSPKESFRARADADRTCLKGWAGSLSALLDRAESRPGLFAEKPDRWTLDDARELRQLWRGILDHVYALEGMKRFWRDAPGLEGDDKAEAFALAHAASTCLYAEGLRWIELTRAKPRLESLLDEPDAEQGTPARAFAQLKLRLLHVATMTRFTLDDRRFRGQAASLKDAWLRAWPAAEGDRVHAILKRRGLQDLIGNGKDILDDALFDAWLPVQKTVAEWMGDTRVTLRRNLVTPEQAREMAARMRPGDLIVERRNWFLSNVGLPGFWPHAVLYLGRPEDLAKDFDGDPDTRAWLASLPGAPATLEQALATLTPKAWTDYGRGDTEGNPFRVIEAVSEGVIFNAVEESCCGDYVAALRPRLRPVDKARAVLEAFRNYGKPYDYNFDFVTDSCLVCSELCWKSYLPAEGKKGLDIPLAEICGRRTLPPNDLIRLYDKEGDGPDRQFDFVYFLDGMERLQGAVVRDAAALRASWKRPKWDVAQK